MMTEERGTMMRTVPDRYELLGVDMDGEEYSVEYVCDCDYCGEAILNDDDVIGIVAPSGEKLIIHEDENISVTELLDFLGVYWTSGDARDVEMILQNH